MKVIWFNGNFGNQIFYCAFKDYLEEKYPKETVYSFIDPQCPDVLIESRTNLSLPKHNIVITILSFIIFKVLGVLFRRIPPRCVPKWYCSKGDLHDSASFFGHSMQEKYYYEQKDSGWLSIKSKSSYSSDYLMYQNLIESHNAICVHVRRGDYVKTGSLYADLSASDYYERAISLAKEELPEGELFFFSDDMEFVKERFKGEKAYFVDCNRGKDSYLDMKLMSLAKVNIMANSTFSYWGAYMGHEKKIVIYPKVWFTKESGRVAPSIMLDSWIGL